MLVERGSCLPGGAKHKSLPAAVADDDGHLVRGLVAGKPRRQVLLIGVLRIEVQAGGLDVTFGDARAAKGEFCMGLAQALQGQPGQSAKDKAFTLLAEIYLMQHTCHWFCKSKTVASTRLLLRHQTPYAKVLESVAPGTRQAYNALIAP